MRSHKFGISSEAITIDCMEFREIQPTLEELNQLSQGGIRVTALPDEIGGPISPDVIIWIAKELFVSVSAVLIVESLKNKIPQIVRFIKEKVDKSNRCSSIEISPEIHLAFKGDNGEFSLKIAENLNSEEMNKLYILFVEMAKLLSKK